MAPILTVDVEDWFHVCGHRAYSDPATWAGREKRVHVGLERILALLDGTGSTATFFVLGWIARQSPALVRRIADAGHEIGCHGDLHRRVFEMTPEEFRGDLRKSRDSLRELVGKPVTSFRAPEWSMRSARNPAFTVLVEEGFERDSSLTTAPPVGVRSNPDRPAMLETASGPILEIPPLMGTFFGFRAMWGGGVCARLTRENRISAALERALANGIPPVLYAHPWEFDDAHPAMPGLSPVQSLVHFAGRTRTEGHWRRLLARHRFAPISSIRAELQEKEEKEEEISANRNREEKISVSAETEEKISENGKKGGVAA